MSSLHMPCDTALTHPLSLHAYAAWSRLTPVQISDFAIGCGPETSCWSVEQTQLNGLTEENTIQNTELGNKTAGEDVPWKYAQAQFNIQGGNLLSAVL